MTQDMREILDRLNSVEILKESVQEIADPIKAFNRWANLDESDDINSHQKWSHRRTVDVDEYKGFKIGDKVSHIHDPTPGRVVGFRKMSPTEDASGTEGPTRITVRFSDGRLGIFQAHGLKHLPDVEEGSLEEASLSVPEQHQKKIALSTLRMSDAGAMIMGGMTKEEAREFLKTRCGYTASRIASLDLAYGDKPIDEGWRDDGINPMDIDPETDQPYSNYSSPSLDTSFHDNEMDVEDDYDDENAPPGYSSLDHDTGEEAAGHSDGEDAMRADVHYPNIHVQLTDADGNAFAILGAVRKALRQNGVPIGEVAAFVDEATTGDYDHLLQTCMKWVNWS